MVKDKTQYTFSSPLKDVLLKEGMCSDMLIRKAVRNR